MRLEIDIPEHHYNNIMALDSVSLGRVPYKGIIMYTINAIKHGKVLEQEPFKPMVEIDLYSVIKQKYIERKVLDKISGEIERQEKWLMVAGYNQYNVDIALDTMKSVVDKCKAESENP